MKAPASDSKHATVVNKKSTELSVDPKERAMTTSLAVSHKEPTKFSLRESEDVRVSTEGLINETVDFADTPQLALLPVKKESHEKNRYVVDFNDTMD